MSGRKKGQGPYKMTLAQQARTMSYYNPAIKTENFLTADRALFILSPENLIRKIAKKIVDWPPFEERAEKLLFDIIKKYRDKRVRKRE